MCSAFRAAHAEGVSLGGVAPLYPPCYYGIEGFALKKAIIASNVDGIPSLIEDGFNGLLFESEDVKDLENKLRRVLSDKNFAADLAENGYKHVYEKLSVDRYIENYKDMIEKTITTA